MSDYEPPAEMVDAMAKELHEVGGSAYGINRVPLNAASDSWQRMMRAEARFVLRRQNEREAGLLEALRQIAAREVGLAWHITASDALAAHAKLDAPKVPEAPTLLEAAKAMLGGVPDDYPARWLSLKAAVEREEKR